MKTEQKPEGRNVGWSAGLDAALAAHVAEHEADGCTRRSLGAVKMPSGYALMMSADMIYYYGLKHDGTETVIDCRKWAIYRWAKRDAEKASNAQLQPRASRSEAEAGTSAGSDGWTAP